MQSPFDDFLASFADSFRQRGGDIDRLLAEFQLVSPDDLRREMISAFEAADGTQAEEAGSGSPVRPSTRKPTRVPVTVSSKKARSAASKPAPASKPSDAAASELRKLKQDVSTLRQDNNMLRQQLKGRERDLERAGKLADSRLEQLRQRDASLKSASESIESLSAQVKAQSSSLQAGNRRIERQEAELQERQATIDSLTGRVEELETQVEEREAILARQREAHQALEEAHRQLQDEHDTLVRELEEGTDRYTRQKQEVLDQQVRESLAHWTQSCQESQPHPESHDQAKVANQARDEIRASLVASTNDFQRDLADISSAMQALDRTRSALRKDLDRWQQSLYVASYERLARCLQTLDIEIWRTMEKRLAFAAADVTETRGDDSALAHWDELIDHLQIVSDYLKSACECFGLRFFRVGEGEAFDSIRHQPYGSNVGAAQAGATVSACVAAGVETQTPDGDTALLRPVIVTLG